MTNPRPTGREAREPVCRIETAAQAEESLVPDARNGMTPSDMVEAKLQILLGKTPSGLFGRFCRRSSART